MKKFLVLVLTLIFCLSLTACEMGTTGDSDKETTYTVTFLNYDNSLLYRAIDIKEGEPAIYSGELPTRPDSNEYTYSFIGWDKDISAIYSNLAVFAKYSEAIKTEEGDSNSEDNENNQVVVSQYGEVENRRYSVVGHSASTQTDLVDAYYDDYYYYYYFNLGKVFDVPLQSTLEVPYYHYTGNNYTKAFKTTKTTTQSVEDSCSTAVTNTVTLSETENLKTGISAKLSTETKVDSVFASEKLSAELSSNIETGYSKTAGKSDSNSRTNSYKQVATSSESTEETTGFGFTDESKLGYYRYIMTGSVDVYTVVIYSKADDIFYLHTLTEVRSFGYSFDYSESPNFDDNQCGSLEFDCSILNDILSYIPTKSLSENTDIVPPPQISEGDTTHYSGGYGTDASPYLIANIEQFSNIRLYPSSVFSVIANIDGDGYSFQPIPNFTGVLKGGNHAIYNFSIEESGTAQNTNIGLFRTNSGTISDLTIGKSGVMSYDNRYSVKYNANFTESNYESYLMIGGFVGKNSGTIMNCLLVNTYITATFADKNNNETLFIYVGGITGYNFSDGMISYCNIETSLFDVEATAKTDSGDNNNGFLGGICGENHATITQCSTRGATLNLIVRGDGKLGNKAYPKGYLGGIVGSQYSGTLTNCYVGGNTLYLYVSSGTYTSATKKQGDIYGRYVDGTIS